MSTNVRVLRCTPEEVFRILGDGWLYPCWVVGASRMRAVDAEWPQVNSRLHHSFGSWPFLLDDITRVEVFDPPHRMVVRAKGWPLGEARVTIDVKPRGERMVIRLQEEAVSGPGSWIPQPLLDIGLRWRNRETLHRLGFLAEGLAAQETRRP